MGVRARVRAALIALFVLVSLVDGFPLATGTALDRLPAPLRRATELAARAQSFLLAPVQPIKQLFRLNQRWTLFRSAKQERHWLSIETRRRGTRGYRTEYRPLGEDVSDLSKTVEYRRVRAAWNAGRKQETPSYRAFARWISARLFREDERIQAVRVRFEEIEVLPRGGFRGTGRYVQEITQRRPRRAP